jgi:hypothetical protein
VLDYASQVWQNSASLGHKSREEYARVDG